MKIPLSNDDKIILGNNFNDLIFVGQIGCINYEFIPCLYYNWQNSKQLRKLKLKNCFFLTWGYRFIEFGCAYGW